MQSLQKETAKISPEKDSKSPQTRSRNKKRSPRSPKLKIKSKPKHQSAPALHGPIEIKGKFNTKHEHVQNPIYAGLAHDEYQANHHQFIGPWTGIRPHTRKSQLRRSSRLQSRSIPKRDNPIKFASLQLKKPTQKLVHFRSVSVLNKRGAAQIKTPQKPMTPQQLEIFKRNTTFKIKKLQPQNNLQPLRVSEVHYFSNRIQTLGSLSNCSRDNEQTQYRLKLRKRIQNIHAVEQQQQNQNKFLDITPRIRQDILEKRKSLQQIRSSILAQNRSRLFDFKRLIPNKTTRLKDLRDSDLAPLTNPPILLLFNHQRYSNDQVMNKSPQNSSPQGIRKRILKFDRGLLIGKSKISKPSIV